MSDFEFKDAEVKRMSLSDLHPAEYNPRTITEEAFGGLSRSIDTFGLMVPIVWNKQTGNIVGGHQRYRYLVDNGEKETDVVVVNLDGQEEVALNVTLNSHEVRGDFTKDVIGLLATTEIRIGATFKEIGLADLQKLLKSKFKEKKKKEDPKAPVGDMSGGPVGDNLPPTAPEAIITCPKCLSQWKMRNNEVVFNSITGTGERVQKDVQATM